MAQFGQDKERKARLEKMVATKRAQVGHGDGRKKKSKTREDVATTQLRLAFETEEERRAKMDWI